MANAVPDHVLFGDVIARTTGDFVLEHAADRAATSEALFERACREGVPCITEDEQADVQHPGLRYNQRRLVVVACAGPSVNRDDVKRALWHAQRIRTSHVVLYARGDLTEGASMDVVQWHPYFVVEVVLRRELVALRARRALVGAPELTTLAVDIPNALNAFCPQCHYARPADAFTGASSTWWFHDICMRYPSGVECLTAFLAVRTAAARVAPCLDCDAVGHEYTAAVDGATLHVYARDPATYRQTRVPWHVVQQRLWHGVRLWGRMHFPRTHSPAHRWLRYRKRQAAVQFTRLRWGLTVLVPIYHAVRERRAVHEAFAPGGSGALATAAHYRAVAADAGGTKRKWTDAECEQGVKKKK